MSDVEGPELAVEPTAPLDPTGPADPATLLAAEPDPARSLPLTTAERQGLEALLFLADEPLELPALAEALERTPEVVEAALEELVVTYEREERGIQVRRSGGGWRMYSAAGARPVLERWALAGRSGRLTQAALETLAVIAYKQPITRQDIGEIRGVNADGAVRNLVARGLVTEVGRESGPGQPVQYGTTTRFLERLGLDRLDELPPLTDYLPEAPAPDEPELGALREVRRRLAAGGELPGSGLAGRTDRETNTGTPGADPEPEDDDLLPAPSGRVGAHGRDPDMDALTDQLEQAARNAVGRLRAAVAAGDAGTRGDHDPATSDPDPDPDHEEPDDGE